MTDQTQAGLSGIPRKRKVAHLSTTFGNHKLHPSTMMMGYGFDPALSEGSLKPPIFLTSTYADTHAKEAEIKYADSKKRGAAITCFPTLSAKLWA